MGLKAPSVKPIVRCEQCDNLVLRNYDLRVECIDVCLADNRLELVDHRFGLALGDHRTNRHD